LTLPQPSPILTLATEKPNRRPYGTSDFTEKNCMLTTTDAFATLKQLSGLIGLAAALACSQELPPAEPAAAQGNAYYVAADGSDCNSGLSPSTPWKTVSKVNATFLEPGDSVYFRRGDTWREQLTVSSSGQPSRTIYFGAYGRGEKPRFAGTVSTVPHRNAVRNAGFEEFTGVADDGLTDDFLHFFNVGGLVEAVSDSPAGGGDVAMRLAGDATSAGVYAKVFLPASARVKMRWQAKSIHGNGAVTLRHWLKNSSAVYLQDDLQTWSTEVKWGAFPVAAAADGIWKPQSVEFTTDDVAGTYQIYFSSADTATGSATFYLDDIELVLEWESVFDHTHRLGTGYEPKRVLLRIGENWLPALNGKDFDRTIQTLDDLMWMYDPDSGMLYFRDESGRPPASGILLEVSVPEADSEGECGIYIDQAHISIANLAVVGWPDENPGFSHAGGIAITENVDQIHVTGCEIAFNYRVGLRSAAGNSTFSDNVFAYNGGNGFSLVGPGHHNRIAGNEAKYNGYWGTTEDDGEGIALGSGTADNLLEWNVIHHNNRHPHSWNPGGLVVYHSNHNVIRCNRVYSNYKAGVVIDGAENQFYYNLVFGNGIGYAETGSEHMYNIMVRDYSPDGPGGNRVFNNIFFGGTSDTRWMGNLFINRNCTETEIRNNVFWGFVNDGYNNVQIRVDGGRDLSGTALSNNVIGPAGPRFIHFNGVDYDTLNAYQTATGQGLGSLSIEPSFLDPGSADFRLSDRSALIDAGMPVGLLNDFARNPVDRLPDIGAFEYHPF
jgi:hypothetical protein